MYQYAPDEKYAFISYAHKNSDHVIPILNRLYEDGYRIWYDSGLEVGSEWAQDIEKYLKGAHSVIAFISRASLDSINCRNEVTYALNMRKPILVVYLEDVELAHGMGLQLASFHALYYYRARSFDDFYKELAASEHLLRVKGEAVKKPSPEKKEKVAEDVAPEPPKKTEADSSAFDHSAEVMVERGKKLYYGRDGVEKDELEAIDLFRRAAKMGYAEAQFIMGVCPGTCKKVEKSFNEKKKWLIKAANQGHVKACLELLSRYAGYISRRKRKKYVEYLCQKENAEGYYWYAEGVLQFGKDPLAYTRMLKKSVEGGCAEACVALGNFYAGEFVCDKRHATDDRECIRWMEKGMEMGSISAINHLAAFYSCGHHVEKDTEKAEMLTAKSKELTARKNASPRF